MELCCGAKCGRNWPRVVGNEDCSNIGLEFTVPLQVVSRQKMSSICQEELLLTQELFILPFSINVL